MNDVSLGNIILIVICLLLFETGILGLVLFVKGKLTKSRFFRFLSILLIGVFSSLIPMGLVSVALGFPAALLSSILVSVLLDDKGNKK